MNFLSADEARNITIEKKKYLKQTYDDFCKTLLIDIFDKIEEAANLGFDWVAINIDVKYDSIITDLTNILKENGYTVKVYTIPQAEILSDNSLEALKEGFTQIIEISWDVEA